MIDDIRCGQCQRKLGEGRFIQIAIKCPRCGTLNHFRDERPTTPPNPHAHERPAKDKDAHEQPQHTSA